MGNALADESTAEAVLAKAGQEHLVEGLTQDQRQRLLAQVLALDAAYVGGLEAYVRNARQLLAASQRGDNPMEGLIPSVPTGERLTYGDSQFQKFEDRGMAEAGSAVFVLVAGGLGERLGFPGIKLRISVSLLTGWSFIEYYCRGILALQQRHSVGGAAASTPIPCCAQRGPGEKTPIPLVIMTSDDTHAPTVALLEESNYFGLERGQVHVLKQEKVACLIDSDARLAKDPNDPGLIETKPHGHGDIHALFHTSGLARRFQEEGKRWLVFFQDTNALFYRGALATLGVSAEQGFAMNSVSVPRKPKDAMGAIAKLDRADGSSLTLNVEYNQLDPLLRATSYPDGDVADETGFSPFPGNMNSLVFAMDQYVATLERTSGIIAEFVNPKYADSSRTKFKSSTRLECMMQDFPKELPPQAKVGFTMFDTWSAYSPVKNSPAAASQKFREGNHPQSGTTGETDVYAANCRTLRLAGASVEEPAAKRTFNGIDVAVEAIVVWSPQWALSFRGVSERLPSPGKIKISNRSTLLLDGDIVLEDLTLDGALTIVAKPGCRVRVARLSVRNAGCILEPVADEEQDPQLKIKGFRMQRNEVRELVFDSPGEHVVSEPSEQRL